MNKVYVLPPREDWIVDRFVREWNEDNSDITVTNFNDANVIWLLADWCWRHIPYEILQEKKVLTTVHHIVPEKFGINEKTDFHLRDKITSEYHVFNQTTFDFVRNMTTKPIHLIPYWANQKIWKKTGTKEELRKKFGLPQDVYIIGSFQRDTEGHDLISPKLEKGPDILCDYIESMHKNDVKLHVVLAGWRRQYVIDRLKRSGINFSYYEKPTQTVVNDLYQTLDLYPMTARCEGGPQSLIECGLIDVPVVSRDTGIARQVLPDYAINNDIMRTKPAIPYVNDWKLPKGYSEYRNLISKM